MYDDTGNDNVSVSACLITFFHVILSPSLKEVALSLPPPRVVNQVSIRLRWNGPPSIIVASCALCRELRYKIGYL